MQRVSIIYFEKKRKRRKTKRNSDINGVFQLSITGVKNNRQQVSNINRL